MYICICVLVRQKRTSVSHSQVVTVTISASHSHIFKTISASHSHIFKMWLWQYQPVTVTSSRLYQPVTVISSRCDCDNIRQSQTRCDYDNISQSQSSCTVLLLLVHTYTRTNATSKSPSWHCHYTKLQKQVSNVCQCSVVFGALVFKGHSYKPVVCSCMYVLLVHAYTRTNTTFMELLPP
jgi:hypothetical protein